MIEPRRKIIAVSAGQDCFKRVYSSALDMRTRYLNYGLLGLCTILNEKLGLDIMMIDGFPKTPDEVFSRLEKEGIDLLEDCDCILLSIPSFYSIEWCASFCEKAKKRYNKRIIVGGRWVVDNNEEWIREKLIYIDEIICGFGEKKLAELLAPDKAHTVEDGSLSTFDHLNYNLLLDYQQFQPSIEISRGCGSGCAFCSDRANKRLQNKPVSDVMRELDMLDNSFGDYTVYLEAPHFVFNQEWCQEFVNAMKKRKKIVGWRCTSRVESIPIERIGMLAEAGLKVIDIGLESASETQLVRMNKTKHPKQYLERATKILEECQKHGVYVKLNILLFAGETQKTIDETICWLKERRHLIRFISVSSLVWYRANGDLDSLLALGAKIPENIQNSFQGEGYINLDLSEEISHNKALSIGFEISRMFTSHRDYFTIKSIGYFERGYTYETFLDDIHDTNPVHLPFHPD